MAKYFNHTSCLKDISVSELIAELDSLGDELFNNEPKIIELLSRVYQSPKFLTDYLIEQIHNTKMFRSGNPYSAQVFMLHSGKNYAVRASIWEEASKTSGDMFFYDVAHDHDFSFYTLGYHGSGYKTRIAQYDALINLQCGDSVDLVNDKVVQLTQGLIMLYEKGKDIHAQIPPKDFSISINIVNTSNMLDDQYYFDFDTSKVIGYVPKDSDVLEKLQTDFI